MTSEPPVCLGGKVKYIGRSATMDTLDSTIKEKDCPGITVLVTAVLQGA